MFQSTCPAQLVLDLVGGATNAAPPLLQIVPTFASQAKTAEHGILALDWPVQSLPLIMRVTLKGMFAAEIWVII